MLKDIGFRWFKFFGKFDDKALILKKKYIIEVICFYWYNYYNWLVQENSFINKIIIQNYYNII